MSPIPTKPCPPGMVKVVALAMLYGITIYERSDFKCQVMYCCRRQDRAWNVPGEDFGYFRLPDGDEDINIGPDGPTLEQWTQIFRALQDPTAGWCWNGPPAHGSAELVLPEDYDENSG